MSSSPAAGRAAALRCGARASPFGGVSRCGAQAVELRASVVVALRLSCSVACGIFPDRGSNPCPRLWPAALNLPRPSGKRPLNVWMSAVEISGNAWISSLAAAV